MKLRLQANSVRLRLKRGEVVRLIETGALEEKIQIGPDPGHALVYRLETDELICSTKAVYDKGVLIVQVPGKVAREWATGNLVGIDAKQPVGSDRSLHVLVEKDFACLNGTDEQNTDTFPNPLAGTKC